MHIQARELWRCFLWEMCDKVIQHVNGCRNIRRDIPAAFLYNIMYMISGSKDQKVVRACTIRLLNLGPATHEKVAIYVVNQRISNV